VAIKVNLLPRAAAPARAGVAISAPRLAVGGGLAVQIATAILALVILALGWMGYRAWSDKSAYAKQITELRERNDDLKRRLVELRAAEAAKREIQRRLEVIGRVAKSQGVPVAILEAVHKAVTPGIWLTSLDMKPQEVKVKVEVTPPPISYTNETLQRLEQKRQEAGGGTPAAPAGKVETKEVLQLQGFSILIKGLAFTNLQLADFMDNLRKTGVFSDVDFIITQAERIEQTRVMSFEVTAGVKL
jgi:Tfp pilus assembly protein PilN